MRATGIVRKVDKLGRVVIPKELRKTLQINCDDSMEIFVNGEQIILRKYRPCCIFCGNVDNAIIFEGMYVCRQCLAKLANQNK